MNANTNLPAVRCGTLPAVREIDDPDLMVNLVNRHPGYIRRRTQRQIAHRNAIRRAEENRNREMWNLTLLSQFTTFAAVTILGLTL